MPHILLYLLALLSLSTSSNWAKLNQMPSEVLGFWRLAIACLLLIIWVYGIKKTPWPRPEKKLLWVLLSGFFLFLHLWSYKYASKNTSIANTMILFATNPIWATIGAIAFFKEKITKRLIYAYILATLGIVVLVYNQINFHSLSFAGDISALVSALFYALFMLVGKKARRDYTNTVFASFQYLTCSIFFFLTTLATGKSFIGYSDVSWFSVIGQVLIPTFLGHFAFTYLVQHMDLSLMTCGKLIEPIFGSIIAYYLFKEILQPEAYLAFALTSLSLIVLFAPQITKTLFAKKT
ncbi:MAG: DMT family transporter [Pseudobdellovibrio sp.]